MGLIEGLTDKQIILYIKKNGGIEAVKKYIQETKDPEPLRCWREQDGIIYFSVTSNGMTGEQWVKEIKPDKNARHALLSEDFKPTKDVTTKIAILKGELFDDDFRITHKIRLEANHLRMTEPSMEVACLIRKMFTNEEIEIMGLKWIVSMHEPVDGPDGYPGLLGTDGTENGGPWLCMHYGRSDGPWISESGFAFAAPESHLSRVSFAS